MIRDYTKFSDYEGEGGEQYAAEHPEAKPAEYEWLTTVAMELCQWFTSRQVTTIEAYVQNANSMAMGFWQKQGFISWVTTIRKTIPNED